MTDDRLRFIGVVESAIRDRKQMPPLGAPAAVELHPEFADGLLRIEKHSHFWVLAWLIGRPERDVLRVTPRGVDPNTTDATHGVFAVRSPARPNPIGLTAARLLRRDGLRLEFDLLDFLDGTPILDLKPYFPARDAIPAAISRTIGQPRTAPDLRQSLWIQAANFCGTEVDEPDVKKAVDLIAHYREEILGLREPGEWEIHLPANRPHLLIGIMAVTRARLGREIHLHEGDDVVINGWNCP
jgi:tRNA (adenine37-N6)-methyltransferase